MYLADANVLINAFRPDSPHHLQSKAWLEGLVSGQASYAYSDHVLSGVLRTVTNPRAAQSPNTIEEALEFTDVVRAPSHAVQITPGPSHWSIFTRLCRDVDAKANLVPDAFFAALAIESSCEWVTYDRDYARFKGLRWATPTEILARGY
jgi:toxin-antitoxin system PIN domain toxin